MDFNGLTSGCQQAAFLCESSKGELISYLFQLLERFSSTYSSFFYASNVELSLSHSVILQTLPSESLLDF